MQRPALQGRPARLLDAKSGRHNLAHDSTLSDRPGPMLEEQGNRNGLVRPVDRGQHAGDLESGQRGRRFEGVLQVIERATLQIGYAPGQVIPPVPLSQLEQKRVRPRRQRHHLHPLPLAVPGRLVIDERTVLPNAQPIVVAQAQVHRPDLRRHEVEVPVADEAVPGGFPRKQACAFHLGRPDQPRARGPKGAAAEIAPLAGPGAQGGFPAKFRQVVALQHEFLQTIPRVLPEVEQRPDRSRGQRAQHGRIAVGDHDGYLVRMDTVRQAQTVIHPERKAQRLRERAQRRSVKAGERRLGIRQRHGRAAELGPPEERLGTGAKGSRTVEGDPLSFARRCVRAGHGRRAWPAADLVEAEVGERAASQRARLVAGHAKSGLEGTLE